MVQTSDSVCSLWPAPFSYLCVRVRILGVLKIVCGWANKTWLLPYACCGLHFIDSAACVLSFDHSTPLRIYECMCCRLTSNLARCDLLTVYKDRYSLFSRSFYASGTPSSTVQHTSLIAQSTAHTTEHSASSTVQHTSLIAQSTAHTTEHSAMIWWARGSSVTSHIPSQSCTTSTQRQRHLAATNSKEQSKRHTDNSKEQKSGRQHERLRELPESHCNRPKRAATV